MMKTKIKSQLVSLSPDSTASAGRQVPVLTHKCIPRFCWSEIRRAQLFHNIHVFKTYKRRRKSPLILLVNNLSTDVITWQKQAHERCEGDHSWYLRTFIFFFFFSRHFLQQYRHHRIHSFTNTKHTTTLVAAAVKEDWGGGCRFWRLPVEPWWSYINLPFSVATYFFSSTTFDGRMTKASFSDT